MRIVLVALVFGIGGWLDAGVALAATAQQKCDANRLKAKAKYEKCVSDWLAKTYAGKPASIEKLAKCRIKYASVWPKVQKLSGTTCDRARFEDNGDGTISDFLTGLRWEKKGDDGGVHDRDAVFAWSAGAPYLGNGAAFSTFLTTQLNVAGFAGSSDWRMPSFAELQTIVRTDTTPCVGGPCVPAVFDSNCTPGCDIADCSCSALTYHWSATENITAEDWAWAVEFGFGSVHGDTTKGNSYSVRAVRGGF